MYYNRANSVNVSSRPHSSIWRQPGRTVLSSAERVQCSATVNPGKEKKKGKKKRKKKAQIFSLVSFLPQWRPYQAARSLAKL
jgi:hypothetical protein